MSGKVDVYLGTSEGHPVVAVSDGRGRALCVSLDKHWTFVRKWGEIEDRRSLVPVEDPAVRLGITVDDIKGVVRDVFDTERGTVWSYAWPGYVPISEAVFDFIKERGAVGDNPVLYGVREGDVAEVYLEYDDLDGFIPEGEVWFRDSPEEVREWARGQVRQIAVAEAVARAMERAEREKREREDGEYESTLVEKCEELVSVLYPGRQLSDLSQEEVEVVKRAARHFLESEWI